MAGSDWSIVSTSDGKKYYYDNKQKVRSRPWLRATLGAVWMGATARHRAWRSVAGISGVTLQVSTIIEHKIMCAFCEFILV